MSLSTKSYMLENYINMYAPREHTNLPRGRPTRVIIVICCSLHHWDMSGRKIN